MHKDIFIEVPMPKNRMKIGIAAIAGRFRRNSTGMFTNAPRKYTRPATNPRIVPKKAAMANAATVRVVVIPIAFQNADEKAKSLSLPTIRKKEGNADAGKLGANSA